jgi:ribosome-binding protein aMBF1 (putative translation factor)
MTPDQWRERVGQHLERRREHLGYSSRYQIADGIPVSESWVRQIESGEVRRNDGTITTPNPRGNKLRAYLERLDWPVLR